MLKPQKFQAVYLRAKACGILCLSCFLATKAIAQPAPTPSPAPMLPELVVPTLPSGTPSPVPMDRPLTLQEAITLALQAQPQLGVAGGSLEAAEGRLRQATSQILPTVSVSSQYTKTGPTPSPSLGSTRSYSTSISGRQLVYDFGKTPAAISQSRDQRESARQSLERTRQEVINQVKQSYYVLLQTQRLVEVQKQTVADQNAHLAQTKAFLEAGTSPLSDVVKAETAVADAVFNLATAQNNAAIARVNLNLALGIDARFPTQVAETSEPPITLSPADLVQIAFDNRPDMKQARANLRASQEAVKVAKKNNWPSVSVDATYNYQGPTFPPDNRNWLYGAVLQWPFLDIGATSGGIQAAKGNLYSTEASLRQTEQTVSSDVTQAYLNVQTAEQKVASTTAEVANAEESLRLAAGRYQTGVGIFLEVIDAEAALVTAQTNQVNALYGLSTARAALQLALGTPEIPTGPVSVNLPVTPVVVAPSATSVPAAPAAATPGAGSKE